MSLLRGKILTILFLVTFVVAKGSFWISLGFAQSAPPNRPTAHPCACSGAPVCHCGPGGCCKPEKVAGTSPDGKPSIHSPKLCGHFGQGLGQTGEPVMAPLVLDVCLFDCDLVTYLKVPVLSLAPLAFSSLDPPPPKA